MSYQNEIEGLLDIVNRGCVRLMRAGGGSLAVDKPSYDGMKRMTPDQVAHMLEMARSGRYSEIAIARELGFSPPAIGKRLRKAGIKVPHAQAGRSYQPHILAAQRMVWAGCPSAEHIRKVTGASMSVIYDAKKARALELQAKAAA